jgi:hypothetical protein
VCNLHRWRVLRNADVDVKVEVEAEASVTAASTVDV